MKGRMTLLCVLLASAALAFAGGGRQQETGKTAGTGTRDWKVNGPFHIGILTETVSQAEDDLRGAEELIRRYGRVSDGGIIQHITYPDNFMDQQEVFISQVVSMADDPLMKAIIINNAIPGTA
ncbi:MAG: DUF3798 domain-containing protein, partial [Treponema sp.]|nr:DUF3798 domain-containing protein [Treponema sp.]